MPQILSQEEVDALLRGISGGDIETEVDDILDPSAVTLYDLTSQDRIIRGRMPTLEMINEKFARLLRTTLSSLMRKVISVNTVSVNMIKFGEFLKTLPVPTSLHLFRMDPLRGNAIFIMESKIIFTLVDILFGGTGKEFFKVEGREFTSIENSLIRKVIMNALVDLEKAWKSLIDLNVTYQRSEVNPQFAQIVSLTDVVVVVSFEIEVEYNTGIMSLCIPYSSLEPIRDKLQAGFQSEQMDIDKVWAERFKDNLCLSRVEVVIELGKSSLQGRDIVELKKGDVIVLDQDPSNPLFVLIEGVPKFLCKPGIFRGSQAVQISRIIETNEVIDYGTE
ncbi:MAG: flagellar motor switch protein FliM [Syntrophobacterales bacterium]|jgi:flagellar motor switch protein FliM|nr:flagellar motor switch protein FliM [Syntrophobacterales bacterium]